MSDICHSDHDPTRCMPTQVPDTVYFDSTACCKEVGYPVTYYHIWSSRVTSASPRKSKPRDLPKPRGAVLRLQDIWKVSGLLEYILGVVVKWEVKWGEVLCSVWQVTLQGTLVGVPSYCQTLRLPPPFLSSSPCHSTLHQISSWQSKFVAVSLPGVLQTVVVANIKSALLTSHSPTFLLRFWERERERYFWSNLFVAVSYILVNSSDASSVSQ